MKFIDGIILAVLIITVFVWGVKAGYEVGQTEALHGKWSYRLKTNIVEKIERIEK